jgi:hypothetical protein
MKFIMLSFFTILCLTACNTDNSESRADSNNIDNHTEASYEDVEELAEGFYEDRKNQNFGEALDFIHPIAMDKAGRQKWMESISKGHKFGELKQATLLRTEETKDVVFLYYEVEFTKRKVYERLKFQAIRAGGWGISGFAGRKEDANYDD